MSIDEKAITLANRIERITEDALELSTALMREGSHGEYTDRVMSHCQRAELGIRELNRLADVMKNAARIFKRHAD